VDPGKRIKVQIPEALGASELLSLRGRVIRAGFDKDLGRSGLYSLAVLFEKLSSDERNELEWILEERSKGPPRTDEGKERGDPVEAAPRERGIREIAARNIRSDPRFEAEELDLPAVDVTLDPIEEDDKPLESIPKPSVVPQLKLEPKAAAPRQVPESKPVAPPAPQVPETLAAASQQAPEAAAATLEEDDLSDAPVPVTKIEPASGDAERRTSRRASFGAKVPAFGSRALRVLVGRDLSVGGMRVEANSDISIGDRLHLAIYGDPGEEPLLVWATVERDDGGRGFGLAFDPLHDVVANQLERLVVSLPAVESLHDSEADAMGTVISEVLPTEDA
jgi:hypothetical protein